MEEKNVNLPASTANSMYRFVFAKKHFQQHSEHFVAFCLHFVDYDDEYQRHCVHIIQLDDDFLQLNFGIPEMTPKKFTIKCNAGMKIMKMNNIVANACIERNAMSKSLTFLLIYFAFLSAFLYAFSNILFPANGLTLACSAAYLCTHTLKFFA